MYNLTNLTNSTDYVVMLQNVNVGIMGGWFGTLILIGITVIIFLGLYFSTGESSKSIAATAFISFILSALLAGMQLVPARAVFILLIIAAVSVAFLWKND